MYNKSSDTFKTEFQIKERLRTEAVNNLSTNYQVFIY